MPRYSEKSDLAVVLWLRKPIRVALSGEKFRKLVEGQVVRVEPGFGTTADVGVEVELLGISLDEMYRALDEVRNRGSKSFP